MARTPVPRGYAARDVFKSAFGFNATCQIIRRLKTADEPEIAAFIGNPYISMCALTIELLLKTFHALQTPNPVPGIHDLEKLYLGLAKDTQRAIQSRWDPIFTLWHERWDRMRAMSYGAQMEPLSPSVATAFRDAAKAFEQNRYTFEPSHKAASFYIDDLRVPLIELLIERHPELAVWTIKQTGMSWGELDQKYPHVPSKTPPAVAPEDQKQK